MPILSTQCLFKERQNEILAPYTLFSVTDCVNECGEVVSGTFSIPAATGPIELSLGTITKGKIFVLRVLGEGSLKVFINGVLTDPIETTFLVLESDDTTGITSLHVKNEQITAVLFRWFLGGDIT